MLEIHVFDQVNTCDDLEKTIEFVVEQLKQWYAKEDRQPFQMFVKDVSGRSPPALNINVSENVKTLTAFG